MSYFSDNARTISRREYTWQKEEESTSQIDHEIEKPSLMKRTLSKVKSIFTSFYRPRALSANFVSRAFANSSASFGNSNPRKKNISSHIRHSLMDVQTSERDSEIFFNSLTDIKSEPQEKLLNSDSQTYPMLNQPKKNKAKAKKIPDTIIPLSAKSKKKDSRIVYFSQVIGEVQFQTHSNNLRSFPLYKDSQTIRIPPSTLTFNETNFDEDSLTEDELRIHLIAKGFLNIRETLEKMKENNFSNKIHNSKKNP